MSERLYPLCPAGLPDCWDCAPESFEPIPAPDPVAIRNAALEEAIVAVAPIRSAALENRPWDAAIHAAVEAIRALKVP